MPWPATPPSPVAPRLLTHRLLGLLLLLAEHDPRLLAFRGAQPEWRRQVMAVLAADLTHGQHRHVFTVHALKLDKLPLDENAPAAMVGFYLNQNALGKAVLKGRYGR